MSRKSSVSREVLVDVLKRLMAEIDDPSPLVAPEVDDGLDDVDGLLDGLLTSATTTCAPTPATAAPEPVSGTKPISIRLPKRIINVFKAEAIKTGTGYQILMRRALADAAEKVAL
jgi:uncharacterized protein (DUF4415 family)